MHQLELGNSDALWLSYMSYITEWVDDADLEQTLNLCSLYP